jgi:adenine phosphoribosyltransferase
MLTTTEAEDAEDLAALVRAIPNYPKPGIIFRDVTTLFASATGLARTVDAMAAPFEGEVDIVAGIDARGFILGGALAVRLRTGFVPIRKKGKLPASVYSEQYELEYGIDELEIHTDAMPAGARVLLADDLIATGGTARAAASLIGRAGGRLVAATFVIDLPDLGGAAKLRDMGLHVHTVMGFEGH